MALTLDLPDDLQQLAEVVAAERGQSLQEVAIEALATYLASVTAFPNGLASLAEEDPELAAELAAWEVASDEALALVDEGS